MVSGLILSSSGTEVMLKLDRDWLTEETSLTWASAGHLSISASAGSDNYNSFMSVFLCKFVSCSIETFFTAWLQHVLCNFVKSENCFHGALKVEIAIINLEKES